MRRTLRKTPAGMWSEDGLNVAVVTAMVPPKGIPHPLVSYGGSNLVVSVLSLGIVLSLSRTPNDGTIQSDV